MGLFKNLWDGVKSAGQWALDHSTTIAPVVEAVGKAAGHLLLMDTSTHSFTTDSILQSQATETDSQNLAKYHERFASVSSQLAATATAGIAPTRKMPGKTTTVDDDLVGLWTDPQGLSPDGKLSTSMYQDLSAFIGITNIPVSWKDDSGRVHDTVNEIGQILFAKTGSQDLAVLAESENPVAKVNAEVPTQDGILQACHVYYPIPMGKGGENFSLHSAVHLSYTTNAGTPKVVS